MEKEQKEGGFSPEQEAAINAVREHLLAELNRLTEESPREERVDLQLAALRQKGGAAVGKREQLVGTGIEYLRKLENDGTIEKGLFDGDEGQVVADIVKNLEK